MERKRKKFYFIPFIIIGAIALFGGIVMLLWNGIITDLLNLKRISFPQAVGLLVLCKILFGGFRPGPPGGFRRGGQHWRNKLMNLTPEEKEKFKEHWQNRGIHKKFPGE